MPNWKKVIVSGSDAALNSLLVTNGATVSSSLTVTGSLNITGSIQTPNWIDFKTGSDQPQAIGRLGWDDGNGTLNLGLKGGNVNLQLGQEMIARVYNADSVPLTDGMIVYISGSQGNRIAVKRAVATSDALSANTLGMVTEPISVGAEGFITTQGVVNGLNTSALTPGAILYLSSSAGEYTPVKPTAPIHTVIVGYVQRSHATVGSIYVKIDNGYELGELHDVVDTTTTSSYGDLLVKSGSVWTNSKQLTGSYGLTGSLTATSFVGPLQGTASWATNALTASYTPSIAGTDNYIPKFNGSSALENSVMYDDGTNIGIGTTSPGAKLHVIGNISGSSFYPSNAGGNYIQGDGTGLVAGGPSYFYSAGSGGSYFEGNVRIRGVLSNDTAAYMQINGGTSAITFINGYLGVGTSTISARIDTNGSIASNSGLTNASSRPAVNSGTLTNGEFRGYSATSTGADDGFLRVSAGGGTNANTKSYIDLSGYSTVSDMDRNIVIGTSGTERMRIDTSGKVGIGTATPTSNLQVESNNLSAPTFAVSKSFSGGGDGTAVMHAFGYDSGIANTGIQVGVKGTGGFSATDAYPFRVFNQGTAVFDVKSNNGIKFNAYGSGTFTGTATQKLAVDSSGNLIEIPIGAGPVDGSGTANYITRWVDTDTITTSSIYETGGNIGIGTTSPSAKLEVAGGGNIATFGSAGSGQDNYIKFQGSSNAFDVGTTSAGYWGIADSGVAYRFVVTQAGNVGIGTTTPAYKLSVVGKIDLNDGGNSVFIGTNAGQLDDATANINIGIGTNALQNNITGNQNVAVGHNTLPANTQSNNTAVGSNAMQFNTTGFSNTGIGSFALNTNVDGTFNTAVGTAAMATNTSGSSNTAIGSSAQRFSTSGSHNVSLGSTTLQNNLIGNDNVAIGSNAGRYFGTGTSSLTDTSGSIYIGRLARANASGEVNQVVIGMNALGLGSNTVVIGNDNIVTTALKGNVGIGLTNPSYKLDISGSVAQIVSSDTSFTAWYIGNTGVGHAQTYYDGINGDFSGLDYGFVGQNNAGYMEYYVGSLSPAPYHVFSSGNVGVGTTTPSEKLEVQSGTSGAKIKVSNTGGGYAILECSSNATSVAQLSFTNQLSLTGGNVGIGTTSPAYQLDVNGTARVTTLIETSALKYKTNIQPLEPQLSKVTQLEPVTFDWLDKPQTKTNIGLIADEVEKIYPEFVSKTEDGEIEGIEYSKLTTVLIQSIKELKEIVDQQQAQINKLLNK